MEQIVGPVKAIAAAHVLVGDQNLYETVLTDEGLKTVGKLNKLAAAVVFCIFSVFSLHGGWEAPDVNEAHYLCKAKHYWQPDWLKGDAFLETTDAHKVFYWTFGWTTRFMSLPAAAWLGRIVTWGLLAWSWRRLSFAVLPRRWWSVLSAAVFVVLSTYGDLAGEWVVGGVEAKGFAFVLAFLALERVVRGQWNVAVLLCGLAAAFHVLVGGWLLIAILSAWLFLKFRRGKSGGEEPLPPPEYRGGDSPRQGAGHSLPARFGLLPYLLAALLLSLPGIIPAIQLTWGVPGDVVRDANRVYVVHRLSHHLDPRYFPTANIVRHLILLGCWIALWIAVRRSADSSRGSVMATINWRGLGAVVWGAIGLAVVGAVIGLASHVAVTNRIDVITNFCFALERYYWFRTSDFLLPLGVALATTAIVSRGREAESPLAGLALMLMVLCGAAHFGHLLLERQQGLGPRGENFKSAAEFHDWREICQAAQAMTPPDALFLTPPTRHTFHWYAQRREVVNWKDMPQDAATIVAWWDRWKEVNATDHPEMPRSLAGRPAAELRRLAIKYGATHLITERDPKQNYPPLPFRFLDRNKTFVLYEIDLLQLQGEKQ